MKITTKCRASRRLRFKDRKRIMPAEMHPKSFGTFEKQAPGRDSNPDRCDAGPVLYQLNYQANWALVIMWVYRKPVDTGQGSSPVEVLVC